MNRICINILTLMVVLLSLLPGEALANVLNVPGDSVNSNLNEKVCLLTDRNLYVIGEKVMFSAFIVHSPSFGEYDWSKVLYLELIGANGNPVIQTKHLITDFKADGYLQLPDNILTGNYYLKAYTRWMQNFSSYSYAWIRIKIINPFQEGVADAVEVNTDSERKTLAAINKNTSKDRISCHTDKDVYGQRDNVTLSVAVPPTVYSSSGQYSITVIRPDAIDTINYGATGLSVDESPGNFPLRYIPDIRGLSLSGRVIDKVTGQGLPGAHTRLSVLGKNTDYSSYVTTNNGAFLFALKDYTGTTDMYITAETDDDRDIEIQVDKEYANDNFTFFKSPFILGDKEKEAATEMMINFQIEQSFHKEVNDSSGNKDVRIPDFFYGRPTSTTYIDDYIELPTIGEVIFELVPDVSVIRRNDVYYLRSRGYISDLEIYKPLIMIDNIPVSDIAAILKMTPERIERIDVVDRIYAKGDLLFGGIIHLISRKGDLAGIDLPENSYFFSFDGYALPDTSSLTRIKNQDYHTRIPDVRNCLYWNPSVSISPGKTARIEFNTTDRTGNYLIVIRGVTEEGTIIEGKSVFEVVGSYDLNADKY